MATRGDGAQLRPNTEVSSFMYLVTGGAGFIGSHIAAALHGRGERVRILDNFSTGKPDNVAAAGVGLDVVRADLRDRAAVRAAMVGVTIVFHEAALASVPQSIADPATALDVNIVGTHNVLLAARDAGARRVVVASSCAVYGDEPRLPSTETDPPRPISPYAAHKLAGERLCEVFTRTYGLETVALRYFNVFGPRQDPASEYAAVIPRFLTALAAGERPIVFGDGTQTRDFVYIDDVVRANLLAASTAAASGQVMNVGGGTRASLNDLLRIAGGLLGVDPTPEYRDPRPGDIHDSLADITLARRVLGYEPGVPFHDGLARMAATLR